MSEVENVESGLRSLDAAALAELHAEAVGHLDARRAPATKRAYASDWLVFREFLVGHGIPASTLPVELVAADSTGKVREVPLPPLAPIDARLVVLFLTNEARTRKLSTIGRRLAAIRWYHHEAGFDSPTNAKIVEDVMDGLRRSRKERPDRKAAADTAVLRKMLKATPADLRGIRDRALLSVGFAGGFRRSELVALNVEDLRDTPHGFEVMLWSSKGDQYGQGEKVGIPSLAHADTCPVRLLRAWLAASGATTGPLFCRFNRAGQLDGIDRMSTHAVAAAVKRAAKRIGEDPARFAGHSLRSGLITAASDGGATTRTIMAQTRHKSASMIDHYYQKEDKFTDNAASYTGL